MSVRRHPVLSSVLAFVLLLASCGTDDGAPVVTTGATTSGTGAASEQASGSVVPTERLLVVATTTILGDLLSNLLGSDADLVVLLPVGADPHDYRASAAQVSLLHDADLVVANGIGLEEGIIDVLEAAESDGINLLEVGDLLDPLPFAAGDHDEDGDDEGDHDEDGDDDGDEGDHDEDEEHAHSGGDPHFWLDPLRVARAVELIAQELAAVDDSIDWAGRADAYVSEIKDLHAEIETILAVIPPDDRKLVSNHDALGYFAARYGFEVVDTVIRGGATLADPSSAELAALVETIREQGVRSIFAETIESTVLAEALAAEVGSNVVVVELYTGSLGEPGSEADTLIGMLRVNARRIADALRDA